MGLTTASQVLPNEYDKIVKGKDFQKVQKSGMKAVTRTHLIFALQRDDGNGESSSVLLKPKPRVGFIVSSKAGSAVVRNRIKRRLKEAAKRAVGPSPEHRHVDFVIVGRNACFMAKYSDIVADMEKGLNYLRKQYKH